MNSSTFRDAVFQIHHQGRERGHYFLMAEDTRFEDRRITVQGKRLLSFGSCSYLGLEFDPRIVEGAIDAYRRYGSQTSYSRGYLSCPLYRQLEEELLPAIFGVDRTLLLPSTSIAHHVVMPALIDERDAVVIDHQAHRSLDDAVTLQCARSNAKKVMIRHGELEQAIDTVSRLARLHRHVWFMCDGIYSMYGDYLPVTFLRTLLAQAPNVRLYVDDAHGMSWAGTHGRGHFLSRFPLEERVVLVTSLSKGFAAGGGLVVVRDREIIELARLTGGPFSFSGPLRPGDFGATVASAEIHLSEELPAMQEQLRRRVEQANRLCRDLSIPLVIANEAPIFFIALGRAEAVFTMAERLRTDGFHVNVSGFPAVPASRGGLRVALNAVHTEEQVSELFSSIARHLPSVLAKVGVTRAEVDAQFEGVCRHSSATRERGCATLPRSLRWELPVTRPSLSLSKSAPALAESCAELWDRMLGSSGTSMLRPCERSNLCSMHAPRTSPNTNGNTSTFSSATLRGLLRRSPLTTSILKDDSFMSEEVSVALEKQRERDPYVSSRALTTGDHGFRRVHVYLRPGPNRDEALVRLLEAGVAEMAAQGCRTARSFR